MKQINSRVLNGASMRGIAREFKGFAESSLWRHVNKCLNTELSVLREEAKKEQAVNVFEEFQENLAFAKELRERAREYLSDPDDPMKLVLIPQADEVKVAYYDWLDTNAKGMPKKKSDNLHVLLAKASEALSLDIDRVEIKHVDIRKFALDAVSQTDSCIDKFARMAGEYQKEKTNEADIHVRILRDRIEAIAKREGVSVQEAAEGFVNEYGDTLSPDVATQLVAGVM